MTCYLWISLEHPRDPIKSDGYWCPRLSGIITPIPEDPIESWEVPDIIEMFRQDGYKVLEFKVEEVKV